MQSTRALGVLGYVEIEVGSKKIEVPIRSAQSDDASAPLAKFEMDGDRYAIFVRDGVSSHIVERAVRKAAADALKTLSRKLLN